MPKFAVNSQSKYHNTKVEYDGELFDSKKGPQKGEFKPGKVIERPTYYIADFVYTENGKQVVEDTKGFKTKDYILKRKLMLWVHGIRIREV